MQSEVRSWSGWVLHMERVRSDPRIECDLDLCGDQMGQIPH